MSLGSKKPYKVERVWIDDDEESLTFGQKLVRWSADFWEGPIEAGDRGHYVRRTFTGTRNVARHTRTCSFHAQLMAAFG
ncbi:hypothetical protein [Sphingomonas sp.]|uniref:hypothetical protein n=1 Tax=Sphingomonas sp. TaxID=28214 RepID=UPI003B3A8055